MAPALQHTIQNPVQCFSMQVAMNKWFLLNPEKHWAQICLVVFGKNAKTAQLRYTPPDFAATITAFSRPLTCAR